MTARVAIILRTFLITDHIEKKIRKNLENSLIYGVFSSQSEKSKILKFFLIFFFFNFKPSYLGARAAADAVPKETAADDNNTAEKAEARQTETNKHNDNLPISSAGEEASEHPPAIRDTQLPAEQAVHWQIHTPDVPDTFCPDRDYKAAANVDRRNVPSLQSHNQNIPQLDGLTHDHDCINSPASFARVMKNSRWQSHIEAEEERRIEREKDLENIERMIQNHTGLL